MNRAQQNRAIEDFHEMVSALNALGTHVERVIMRGRFESARVSPRLKVEDPERGTPPPAHSDPTGEEAVSVDPSQDVGKTIAKIASTITVVLEKTKDLIASSKIADDAIERAKYTYPDCLACGDPCLGKIRAGLDDKCYQKWMRDGKPDRSFFIAQVKAQHKPSEIESVPQNHEG